MTPLTYEPRAMDTDGAELRLSGGPFPPGTFDHVAALVKSLYEALEPPPEIKKSQPLSKADVLVQSAFALIEDDMAEAETGFAEREVKIDTADGVIPEQEQKVADAIDGLRDTIEAALSAGVRFVLVEGD